MRYSTNDIADVEDWFCNNIAVEDANDYRISDLLVSLFIGSINDANSITADEPDNMLDKVKHKILLFDGKFCWKQPENFFATKTIPFIQLQDSDVHWRLYPTQYLYWMRLSVIRLSMYMNQGMKMMFF